MTLTHPPEPWQAFEEDDGTWNIDHAGSGGLVGDGFTKEEAERICACVNACHGILTHELVEVTRDKGGILRYIMDYEELK